MFRNAVIFVHSPWSGASAARRLKFLQLQISSKKAFSKTVLILLHDGTGTGYPLYDRNTGAGEVFVTDQEGNILETYGPQVDFND